MATGGYCCHVNYNRALHALCCAVPNSMLFIGRPGVTLLLSAAGLDRYVGDVRLQCFKQCWHAGVGKTTVMRELARVLADDFHKRVVIVDTSNELGMQHTSQDAHLGTLVGHKL